MSMRVLAMAMALGVALAGCGNGSEGDECDSSGATEDECEDGLICGKISDDDETLVCLKLCTDHAQCAPDEACNGVEGSDLKGCRKK